MDFRIWQWANNPYLTEAQKENIMQNIMKAPFFLFPKPKFENADSSIFSQLGYNMGIQSLLQKYGEYADIKVSDLLTQSVLDTTVKVDHKIETQVARQNRLLKYDTVSIPLGDDEVALDIPSDQRKELYYALDNMNFAKKESKYILRVPYKHKYVCSSFAPFAHILLALKFRAKREDATREKHSVSFLGRLASDTGVDEVIDFSQYFTTSDYWYYEMETGINLAVEIAATLQELRDKNVIMEEDIHSMCIALKDSLSLIDPMPILTRIYFLRNCVQCTASYMQSVRNNPHDYLTYDNGNVLLKSPVGDYDLPMLKSSQKSFAKTESVAHHLTEEQVSWVFSEVLRTLTATFMIDADATDNWIDQEPGFSEMNQNINQEALVFCNSNHPRVQGYIEVAQGKCFGKNKRAEEIFYEVHSILSRNIELTEKDK